jgi:hypothetical protein
MGRSWCWPSSLPHSLCCTPSLDGLVYSFTEKQNWKEESLHKLSSQLHHLAQFIEQPPCAQLFLSVPSCCWPCCSQGQASLWARISSPTHSKALSQWAPSLELLPSPLLDHAHQHTMKTNWHFPIMAPFCPSSHHPCFCSHNSKAPQKYLWHLSIPLSTLRQLAHTQMWPYSPSLTAVHTLSLPSFLLGCP